MMENFSESMPLEIELHEKEPTNEDHSTEVFVKEEAIPNSNTYSEVFPIEHINKEQCENEDRQFNCTFNGCTKNFTSKKYLRAHEKIHSNIRPHSCHHDSCFKSFRTKNKLLNHMRIHDDQRMYECTYEGCSKSFRYNQHLVYHLSMHSDIRAFTCTFDGCGRNFKTKRDVSLHMQTHSIERRFKCEVDGCFKAFKTKDTLRKHIVSHSDDKSFHCSYKGCSFASSSKRYWYDHMRRHEKWDAGVKYNCKYGDCSKSYNNPSGLKRHLKTHEAPTYLCDTCEKRFDTLKKLTDHKKRHFQSIYLECDVKSTIQSCENGIVKSEPRDSSSDDSDHALSDSGNLRETSTYSGSEMKLEDPLL